MLTIIAAIGVAIWFFNSARKASRSGVGWAVIGALAVLGPSILWYTFIRAAVLPSLVQSDMEGAAMTATTILVAGIGPALGIAAAFWLHRTYLHPKEAGELVALAVQEAQTLPSEGASSSKPPEPNSARVSSNSPPMRWLRDTALLTAPVWGIALLILLLVITELAKKDVGSVLLLSVGALLPFASVGPIWRNQSNSSRDKVLLFVLYYFTSCIAMFVVVWAAITLFDPAR